MQALALGSVILFGSHMNMHFQLNIVFVVNNALDHDAVSYQAAVSGRVVPPLPRRRSGPLQAGTPLFRRDAGEFFCRWHVQLLPLSSRRASTPGIRPIHH
jgi:hypothetical protein